MAACATITVARREPTPLLITSRGIIANHLLTHTIIQKPTCCRPCRPAAVAWRRGRRAAWPAARRRRPATRTTRPSHSLRGKCRRQSVGQTMCAPWVVNSYMKVRPPLSHSLRGQLGKWVESDSSAMSSCFPNITRVSSWLAMQFLVRPRRS